MEMSRDAIRLWEDPTPLFRLTVPRIVRQSSPHRVFLRATCERLRHRRMIAVILKLIRVECGLESGIWNHQRPFFKDLISLAFHDNDDSPAWVLIAGERRSFLYRPETNQMVDTQPPDSPAHPQRLMGSPVRIDKASKLVGRQSLELQSHPIKTKKLLMIGPKDVSGHDLSVWKMTIMQRLDLPEPFGRSASRSRWYFLASHGDQAEQKFMRVGRNPSVEQFRMEDGDIQRSPIISLSRYCRKNNRVYSLNFSLVPDSGQVVDFRVIEQPWEFTLGTDSENTKVLLESTRIQSSDAV